MSKHVAVRTGHSFDGCDVMVRALFLQNPSEIRKEIHGLAGKARSLHLAVAFIGPEWEQLLAHYSGPIRAICWLSHPATDPDAVESMMKRSNTIVKQRHGLHTKVYLAAGVGAVVGSANLSQPALSNRPGMPQCEAAVLVKEPKLVRHISDWFNGVWNDKPQTAEISVADLERARRERKKWPFPAPPTANPVPPPPNQLPRSLFNLARRIESVSLKNKFETYRTQLATLLAKSSLSHSDVAGVADSLAKWTKHRAAYRNFEKQPRKEILRGFRLLVDESRSIHNRLREIEQKRLLRGLNIPTQSLLLYWWRPDVYPPFNAKTKRFLGDFAMERSGMSSSSPACYSTWLGYAEILRSRLHLPTVGHIDQIVSKYYETASKNSKQTPKKIRAKF